MVPAQHPSRADQYDTIIVPEHNGYGLARAIKARMLLELRKGVISIKVTDDEIHAKVLE